MTQGSASRSGIGAKPAGGARWAAVLMKQHSLRGIRVPAREAPSLRTRSDFRLSRADYSGATAPDFHRLPFPETMRTWKDIARNARTVNAPAGASPRRCACVVDAIRRPRTPRERPHCDDEIRVRANF